MMSTNNGREEQVSVSVEGPERSGGSSTAASRPDPEGKRSDSSGLRNV